MSESIESRLTALSSKPIFRNAKKLIKSRDLLCSYLDKQGVVHARFSEGKNTVISTTVKELSDTDFEVNCSCSADAGSFCVHAFASFLYHVKEKNRANFRPNRDLDAKYAGLKFKELGELTMEALENGTAGISIVAETEFPHAPSKWEQSIISATIHFGGKEYKGNLPNLRQLHFDKKLAVSIKLSDFPQQDRQIIRYLAINAEDDGSAKLALDAEQTAEFFQCLSGFKNFLKDGQKVVIHREIALPIIIAERKGNDYTLHPAINVNDCYIPLNKTKVVSGKAGIWCGVSGEYWWIPGFVDVAWLRSFLRSKPQHCDKQSGQFLLSGKALPIEVVEADPKNPVAKRCKVLYSASIDDEALITINLSFNYEGKYFQPDGARLAKGDGEYWRRDAGLEKKVIDELLAFGFSVDPIDVSSFYLQDPEAIGTFLDILVPRWSEQKRGFYMDDQLASLSNGGNGVPELSLSCSLDEETADCFDVHYQLHANGFLLNWKDVVKASSFNRSYILTENRLICKLTSQLSRFFAGVAPITSEVKDKENVVRVAQFSAPYWAMKGSGIPGAVPVEFSALSTFVDRIGANKQLDSEPVDLEVIKPSEHDFVGKLRHYQQQGVSWMTEMGAKGFNLILADEMGLGKTVQTLAMLAQTSGEEVGPKRKKSKGATPSLLLCPTSLIENWRREAAVFVPSFKVAVVSGKDREKVWLNVDDYDLVVCSYNIAKRDIEMFKKKMFRYLILDEAQHIKNPFTGNAKVCKTIKSKHRLVLTGTPLENSPEDLWSIFDFMHPKLLGGFKAFQDTYSDLQQNQDKREDLAQKIAPFIMRRKKKDVCLELPDKIEQVMYCDMAVEQRELYNRYLTQGREQCELLLAKKGGTTKMDVLTTLLRLRQICCYPRLIPEMKTSELEMSAKVELLKEIVLEAIESGNRILLFSQFTSMLAVVRNWLNEDAIKYEYLDGSTKDRMACVDNFNNNDDISLFLLSLKAGGTGLNLTAADTVIIFDPWWNPAVEAQATDRAHRIGQEKVVTNIKLVVKDSIEEKILQMQSKKQQIFDDLVENPESASNKLDMKDIEFLFE